MRSSAHDENQRQFPPDTHTPSHTHAPPRAPGTACRHQAGLSRCRSRFLSCSSQTDGWRGLGSDRTREPWGARRRGGSHRPPEALPLTISKAPEILPGDHALRAQRSHLSLLFSAIPKPRKAQSSGLHTGPLTPTQLPSGGPRDSWTSECLRRCLLLGWRGLC